MKTEHIPTSADPSLEDILPPWKQWGDELTKFFTFIRTRRQILAGVALWDKSKQELQSAQLMEPWHFSIYQSVLSALPLAIVFGTPTFLNFFITKISLPQIVPADMPTSALEIEQRLNAFLYPFLAPLWLSICSFCAAYATNDPLDITPDRLRRARRAYLYYDGAMGLWSQMLLSATLTIFYGPYSHYLGVATGNVVFILFILAAARQWYLSGIKIPKMLIHINGYPYPDTFPPPWSLRHYTGVMAIVGGIGWDLFTGLYSHMIYFCAVTLDHLQHTLQGVLGGT